MARKQRRKMAYPKQRHMDRKRKDRAWSQPKLDDQENPAWYKPSGEVLHLVLVGSASSAGYNSSVAKKEQ